MKQIRILTTSVSLVVGLGTLALCLLLDVSVGAAVVAAALAALCAVLILMGYARIAVGLGKNLQLQRDHQRDLMKEVSRSVYHARLAAERQFKQEQVHRNVSDRLAALTQVTNSAVKAAQAAAAAASKPTAAASKPTQPLTPQARTPADSKPAAPAGPSPLVPPTAPPASRPSPRVFKERVYSPVAAAERAPWLASHQGGEAFRPTNSTPAHRSSNLPLATEISVAMIADDFTYNSFKPEFKTSRLTPQNWRAVFDKEQPELFFCESAWQGGPPAVHPWQGKIYASIRWPEENRGELLAILRYCRERGIPTVFWNKEDPTHFGDRINDFVRTACLFDYVFTTAVECVSDYTSLAAVRSAHVLPFAVQTGIFNPRGSSSAEDNVNFAGTWYGMYPERSARAEQLMDLVLKSGRELVIYNRMFTNKNPIYKFPERFERFTRPAISHEETAMAYRSSRFGITLNTVTNSESMFARRAFELAACGSVVLSNSAKGVETFFGDSVIFADRDEERYLSLTAEGYSELQSASIMTALNNTYTHRAETVLRTVGIAHQTRFVSPTGLAPVQDLASYERALESARGNSALTGLLAVTQPNSEQGLQTAIMRRRDLGTVVVTTDDLRTGRLRVRNYLSTPGVVVAGQDGHFPSARDIARLLAHSQYEDGMIKKAMLNESKFRYRSVDTTAGAYIPAHVVPQVFGASSSHTAYLV